MKPSACCQHVHYQHRLEPQQRWATKQQWCVTPSLPSARTVKGESPGLLAENWPPREVIRKHRLKKPIPTTKILQEGDRDKGIMWNGNTMRLEHIQQTEADSRRRKLWHVFSGDHRKRQPESFVRCTSQSSSWTTQGKKTTLCTRSTVSAQMNHYLDGLSSSHCAQWASIQNKSMKLQANGCV